MRLTTSPPSVRLLSRWCEILNIAQSYMPPRHFMRITLIYSFLGPSMSIVIQIQPRTCVCCFALQEDGSTFCKFWAVVTKQTCLLVAHEECVPGGSVAQIIFKIAMATNCALYVPFLRFPEMPTQFAYLKIWCLHSLSTVLTWISLQNHSWRLPYEKFLASRWCRE